MEYLPTALNDLGYTRKHGEQACNLMSESSVQVIYANPINMDTYIESVSLAFAQSIANSAGGFQAQIFVRDQNEAFDKTLLIMAAAYIDSWNGRTHENAHREFRPFVLLPQGYDLCVRISNIFGTGYIPAGDLQALWTGFCKTAT